MAQKDLSEAARRLRALVLAVMILIGLVAFIAVAGITFGGLLRIEAHARAPRPSADWILPTAMLSMFVLALWRLVQMLSRIAAGERFTPAVNRPFRAFAFWLLLVALAALFKSPLEALPAVIGLVDRPSGGVPIRIEVRDIVFTVASLVLFLVARLLDDAAVIAADLDEIV